MMNSRYFKLLALTVLMFCSLVTTAKTLHAIQLPVRSEVLYGGVEVADRDTRYPHYAFTDLPSAWQKSLLSNKQLAGPDEALKDAAYFLLPVQGEVQGVLIWLDYDGLVCFELAILRHGQVIAGRKLLEYDPEADTFNLKEFVLKADYRVEIYTQKVKRNKKQAHVPSGPRRLSALWQLQPDGQIVPVKLPK